MTQTCRHWRSKEWGCVHDLEDLMALVADIDDHRLVIKRHAWREGSWQQVYAEACAMKCDLEKLQIYLTELHQKWIAETHGNE